MNEPRMRPHTSRGTSVRRLGVLALAGLFAIVGCDDDPVAPPAEEGPASVQITPEQATLSFIGETVTFSAVALNGRGEEMPEVPVSWTTSSGGTATVSGGVVTAQGNGTATITATVPGTSATAQVTVQQVAAGVAISQEEVLLTGIPDSVQLSAEVRDAGEDGGTEIEALGVDWTSSDESVATVDEEGLVTTVGEGTAMITASHDGFSAATEVTVREAVMVELDPAEVKLIQAGATVEVDVIVRDAMGDVIEDAPLAWESSRESVATVTEMVEDVENGEKDEVRVFGVIEAVGDGVATISVRSGNAEGTVQVEVRTVDAVRVEPDEVTLEGVGATAQLTATAVDAFDVPVTTAVIEWSSSDEEVATVDEDGLVEAVGAGTAVISASAVGVSGTAEIIVEVEEEDDEGTGS